MKTEDTFESKFHAQHAIKDAVCSELVSQIDRYIRESAFLSERLAIQLLNVRALATEAQNRHDKPAPGLSSALIAA